MTELLHNWILGLTASCIVTACALAVSPKGPVERVTRLVCGIVLTAALLAPLSELDMDAYAVSLAEYRDAAARLTQELEETEERLNRVYIEQECAAYILDEARTLGAEGGAEVRARWRDNCWTPWEAELTLNADAAQRRELSEYIAAQLGIPAERQDWHDGG